MYRKKEGLFRWASGKEFACNAGDTEDAGSIPGSGRSLEEGMVTHPSILAWKIPRTEEPGRLSPWGHTESDMTEASEHTHTQENVRIKNHHL